MPSGNTLSLFIPHHPHFTLYFNKVVYLEYNLAEG